MSDHGPAHYKKIWFILLALLLVSFAGPFISTALVRDFPNAAWVLTLARWLTLATAFGIAGVKAYLVAKHFMHITVQPRFVSYMVVTALVFMLMFYAGTAGDVMKQDGDNWHKPAIATATPAHH